MTFAIPLALLVVMALLPATAVARIVAPPGFSEADQYFETVPASAGPRGPSLHKNAQDAVRDGALSGATERVLSARGTAGLGVTRAVAQTSPARAPGENLSRGSVPMPLPGVLGEPGLGTAFPLALIATVAAAVAFVITRRRRAPAR